MVGGEAFEHPPPSGLVGNSRCREPGAWQWHVEVETDVGFFSQILEKLQIPWLIGDDGE